MIQEQIAHNQTCNDGGHGKHLCFLMYEGFHLNHRTEYKALVQDAQFRCQQCGRTAKSKESLCMPEPL